MSKTTSKVLWILAGIFLIITGIGCLRNPGEILYGLPIIFGVAMMFSGIIDIVIFAAGHDYMAGSGWFLADGILTVLMSLFILGNGWFTAMTISFILGMWLIFSGITKLVNSFDLQKLGVRGWGWFTVLGILLTVIGFLSFTHPFASIAAMAWVIELYPLCVDAFPTVSGYKNITKTNIAKEEKGTSSYRFGCIQNCVQPILMNT